MQLDEYYEWFLLPTGWNCGDIFERNCEKKEANRTVCTNLWNPNTSWTRNSISYWRKLSVKECRSGRDAWSHSYHHHLPKPNLWRHVFGVLFINVSIIILSNPHQEGDGGCIWQLELYLSLWTGDLFHLRAGAQECFCSHASMWRIQLDLKEDPCSLIMFQCPMQ